MYIFSYLDFSQKSLLLKKTKLVPYSAIHRYVKLWSFPLRWFRPARANWTRPITTQYTSRRLLLEKSSSRRLPLVALRSAAPSPPSSVDSHHVLAPPRPRSRRLLRRSLTSLLPSPRLSAFHHPHNHNPTRRKGIPFSAKRSNLPARAAVLRRSSSFHMTTACVAAPLSRGHQSRRLEEGRAVLGPQMWSPGRKSGAPPDARDTTSL
jgi:hypothetical protein